MRLTFINPNFTGRRSRDAMEPLAFAILSALCPPGVEKRFYDERVEDIPLNEPTDLVAISVQTFTARRAYAIASAYRSRGIKVVLGGIHPSLAPDEAQGFADCVAMGDAEAVWPALMDDALAGRLKPRYDGLAASPGSPIGPFDRSIFRGKPYPLLKPVQAGRGCRYACDFCSVRALNGTALRRRDPAELASELAAIPSPFIFFSDDNLFADPTYTAALLDAIRPLRKRFACQMSIDAAGDPGFVELLAGSGCLAVFMGFESLDRDRLEDMGKAANLRADYAAAAARLRASGIMVTGSFVFGYPGDGPDSVMRALAFALEQRLCLAHFNILYPFPGTPLLARARAEGRLRFGDWWLHPDYQYGLCMLRHSDTLDIAQREQACRDLEAACWGARAAFNSRSSIMRRALDFKANSGSPERALLYWMANLASRSELRRKHGMGLG